MRSSLLPNFAAALSLVASGAFASVICDRADTYDPSAKVLQTANDCIEDVCAAGQRSVVKNCGPVVLTITTNTTSPLYGVEDCVKEFRNILDHCVVIEGTHGGSLQTNDVVYDIVMVPQPVDQGSVEERGDPLDQDTDDGDQDQDQDDDHKRLESRRSKGGKSRGGSKTMKGTSPKKPTTLKSGTKVTQPKSKKPNAKNGKTKTKPKSKKPKTTPKPKATPKSCPIKQKGKKGSTGKTGKPGKGTKAAKGGKGAKKTTRDFSDDLLPDFLSNALFRRVNKGKAPASSGPGSESECPDEYYSHEVLRTNKVDYWSFKQADDMWDDTHPKTTNPGKVLSKMHMMGKLDVIGVKSGRLQIVGDPDQAMDPRKVADLTGDGSYLLTNGGFFRMRKPLNERHSVGETSLGGKSVPIPERYKDHYAQLEDGDQFLSAGPNLKKALNGNDEIFDWKIEANHKTAEGRQLAGSLVHANQPNERLAIALVGNDKYIFAYTCVAARNCKLAVTTNQLRLIMDEFLQVYAGSSIAKASTALNLDGGGSLWVSWRENGKSREIARGEVGDDGRPFEEATPEAKGSFREVPNFLKIS
jgi:hypothetical protein